MPLANDRYLKIKPNHNNELGVGSEVSIDTGDIKEGTFLSQKEDKKISVENNKIVAITYLQKYDVGNNNYIIVEQNNRSNFSGQLWSARLLMRCWVGRGWLCQAAR